MTESMEIFDRSLLRQRQRRHAGNFASYDYLIREISQRLLDRLLDIKRDFKTVLEIGYPALAENREMQQEKSVETLISADLPYPEDPEQRQRHSVFLDEEYLPFGAQQFDLILVNLTYHHVNDLPGALLQAKRALKPDGLLLATMFGGQTLWQLRHSFMQAELALIEGVMPHIIPMADIKDIGGLLQRAGFALPVVDRDVITVYYRSPLKLLDDLRGMGQSNILRQRHRQFMRRDVLTEMAVQYQHEFGTDQHGEPTVPADYEILFLQGWSPHESQQKPLRPGMGKISLEKVLSETTEKV